MLAGVILAGGRSSRMGTDKSLLRLPENHLSLLEHAKKRWALVCSQHVFVSGVQHDQGIADSIPNCGPLSGIHGVITQIESEHPDINELLVGAVDMPELGTEDLNYLLEMGRKNNSICYFESCFLPLYLPLSVAVSHYLTTHLTPQYDNTLVQNKKSQYSLKKMLDSLQAIQIPALKKTRLDNINTPEQWQEYCAAQPNFKANK
ncbi:molybdenum cofactor guanylyltransferase [uncultured Paraglaciecola sp.]|uniref:molybdenum cofactor guanylyltransferase n=1 Tax=uncultured Paraglaciecola sp. TaxID=1765024 RepID=UPI0030D9CA99|tara:strand:+ start:19907 stop:20518 length:612 start_codon:yes stop_codon:yes gene_type:complete